MTCGSCLIICKALFVYWSGPYIPCNAAGNNTLRSLKLRWKGWVAYDGGPLPKLEFMNLNGQCGLFGQGIPDPFKHWSSPYACKLFTQDWPRHQHCRFFMLYRPAKKLEWCWFVCCRWLIDCQTRNTAAVWQTIFSGLSWLTVRLASARTIK